MNEISYISRTEMSDRAWMQQIGGFVKHHRLSQNKSQDQVAHQANISRSTLSLLERGETATVPILLQVLRVLDLLHALDGFAFSEQISPIALAKLEQKKRRRASGKLAHSIDQSKSDW